MQSLAVAQGQSGHLTARVTGGRRLATYYQQRGIMKNHLELFSTPEALTAEADAINEALFERYPLPRLGRYRAEESSSQILARLDKCSRFYFEARSMVAAA